MEFKNLLEYLIPVIFVIVWFIAKIFGARSEEPLAPPRGESYGEGQDPFAELFGDDFEEREEPVKPEVVESPRIDYQAELAKQRRKVLEVQAQVTKIMQKAKPLKPRKKGKKKAWGRKARSDGGIRGEMLELLKDSNAAKKAFLSYEILGQPVGQRKDGQMGPSWNQ